MSILECWSYPACLHWRRFLAINHTARTLRNLGGRAARGGPEFVMKFQARRSWVHFVRTALVRTFFIRGGNSNDCSLLTLPTFYTSLWLGNWATISYAWTWSIKRYLYTIFFIEPYVGLKQIQTSSSLGRPNKGRIGRRKVLNHPSTIRPFHRIWNSPRKGICPPSKSPCKRLDQ